MLTEAVNEAKLKPLYVDSVLKLEKLYKLLLTTIKLELARMDISDMQAGQALLLYKVGKNPCSIGDLANSDLYLGSNISYNVKKLTERNYLENKRSSHDKRISVVQLTEKGLEFWDKLNEALVGHKNILTQGDVESVKIENLGLQLRNLEKCFHIIIDDINCRSWLMSKICY